MINRILLILWEFTGFWKLNGCWVLNRCSTFNEWRNSGSRWSGVGLCRAQHVMSAPRGFTFFTLCSVVLLLLLSSCAKKALPPQIPLSEHAQQLQTAMLSAMDSEQLLRDLKTLSSAAMQGRKPLTAGSEKAQRYIVQRFKQLGVVPLKQQFHQVIKPHNAALGHNLVGVLPATKPTKNTLVISAHYDHLGKDFQGIYFGADDNASGVATMLQVASTLSGVERPINVILLATDAEETGLHGSKAFIKQILDDPSIHIILNINLDMLAQGGPKNRLFYAASRHNQSLSKMYAQLYPLTPVNLIEGHNQRGFRLGSNNERIDWLNASDHASFRRAGIPYIYFGVDPHKHYHTHTDTYERIEPQFFIEVSALVVSSVAIVLAEFYLHK